MGIYKKFWDVFTEVGIKLMLQKYLDGNGEGNG